MTHLFERRVVACPYSRAREYLRETLSAFAAEPAGHILKLRVPYGSGELAGELSKDVVVKYQRGQDPRHFDEPWEVRWVPAGGGPYPHFDGRLTVRADENHESSVLELDGNYRPPFGAAGELFDALLGARIAAVTAGQLLAEVGSDLERRYGAEEAGKRPPTSG